MQSYADLFEQTLYNGILPGISLEGKDYFYVNALKKLHDFKWPMRWSRTREPNIPASFCCPPNVVRVIAEMHNYVYALSPDTVWVNLYAASTLDTAWIDGGRIKLRQETDYPFAGAVKFIVDEAPARDVTLKLRVPGWLQENSATLKVNGKDVNAKLTPGRYADVTRTWRAGDSVEFTMDFKPTLWEANPLVEETVDQVSIKNGPLVYCIESNDLPEGVRLTDVALSLDSAAAFSTQRETIVNTNAQTLTLNAMALQRGKWTDEQLYRQAEPREPRAIKLKAVPYYAWGNRGDTEMSVWMPVALRLPLVYRFNLSA